VFELHINNVHCGPILFGASTDAGYVRQLLPLTLDEKVNGRIALLEGVKPEKDALIWLVV
jgi:hypothetical protein